MNVLGVEMYLPAEVNLNMELSYDEYTQKRCDFMNSEKGALTGVDCPECLNKGIVYFIKGGDIVCRPCKCMDMRNSIRRMEESGLRDVLELYTFDKYIANDPWQEKLKRGAEEYSSNPEGWMIICGQVGCGKTHLCTAMVGSLLNQGKSARYMQWRDDVVRIKSCVNDDMGYNRLMRPLKDTDVLYIDDFFKTASGNKPTAGDVNVAFELLNYRYEQRGKITILSCECTVDEIMDIDEAVGSRIYQRTKDHCFVIGRDKSKNYRLKR